MDVTTAVECVQWYERGGEQKRVGTTPVRGSEKASEAHLSCILKDE